MRNKAFTSVLLLLSFGLLGQEPLRLDQALQAALENNLDIALAKQDFRVADKEENWGNAGFLPSLNAGASISRTQVDQSQEVAVGENNSETGRREFPNVGSESVNLNLTASYVLFDGLGNVYRWQSLKLQKERTAVQWRFQIENVLLQVCAAFYESARQADQLSIQKEALRLSQGRYQRAQTARDLGTSSTLEALTALVDLRRDSVSYLNAQNKFLKSRRNLNLLLRWPTDTAFAVDSVVRFRDDLVFGALQRAALNDNAALIQAKISRQLAEKQIGLAWSERLPQLSANGGYQYSSQDNEGGFLRFTQTTGWQYGLNAQWNIFNAYRTQTQIETARIEVFKNTLALEQARQNLQADLANAWLDFEQNRAIWQLQGRNLKVAKRSFQRAQEAYALGQITSLQLREAQLNYINAKADWRNLRYNVKLAEVELLRISGKLVQNLPVR